MKGFEYRILEEVLDWSDEKIYKVFGYRLEKIVLSVKEKLKNELRVIWRNKEYYHFRDTGEQLDKNTMELYFSIYNIKNYSIERMENILKQIDEELYLNTENIPRRKKD